MSDAVRNTAEPQTFERLPRVKHRTGLGRTSIYELAAAGKFPKPIKLSERASAWLTSEIDAWIATRIAQSREKAAA